MKTYSTPKWIDSLIDNLAPLNFAEEIRGDLYEMFLSDIENKGVGYARRKYILNGIGFLTRSFFWRRTSGTSANMWPSYFRMAKASLTANKGTAVINLAGLAIAIAAALSLLAVIRFELSFDTFHSKAERIYRVVRVSGEDMSEFRSGVSFPVPRAMKSEIASLEEVTSMEYFGGANVDVLDPHGKSVRKFREESGFALVEPSFFEVLDFKRSGLKWIHGNPERALDSPFEVVLTKSLATKYFGDENPLGQTLKLQQKHDCKITGVIEDLPKNTDFPFTALISYASMVKLAGEERLNDWFSVNDSHHVFVVLPEGTSKDAMEAQIAKVHAAHTPKELHQNRHYLLQPLNKIHYDEKFSNYNGRTISKTTILGLEIVALFLLITGSINYINLSTAQSTLRSKEIGLRKVMGSNQRQVITQFMVETFVLVAIAAMVGALMSHMMILNIKPLLGLDIDSTYWFDASFISVCLLIILGVTLFSGLYPAFIVSGFNPVTALKNRFTSERQGGMSLRKVLVVVQFTITQILVVGTFVVVSQMQFFSNVDMGFAKEGVINTRVPQQDPVKLERLKSQLLAQPYVESVSLSYTLPSGVRRNRSFADIGKTDAKELKDFAIYEYVSIDEYYLDLYKIPLLAGRNLNAADSTSNILVNQTLVKNLSLGTPQDAIGQTLKRSDNKMYTIVGVIGDYYGNSMKESTDNVTMFIDPENYSALSVKIKSENGENFQEATSGIGKIWSETFPDFLFSYQFFDENIASFYEQERKYANLFKIFSTIFLFIGFLGLYGLITFVVIRKSKEVAVRKVLGATVSNILVLFSKEYVQLLILSIFISVPITWYFSREWLNNFAHHIELTWYSLLLPSLLVLPISIAVVAFRSLKTARANPVDKLKYE